MLHGKSKLIVFFLSLIGVTIIAMNTIATLSQTPIPRPATLSNIESIQLCQPHEVIVPRAIIREQPGNRQRILTRYDMGQNVCVREVYQQSKWLIIDLDDNNNIFDDIAFVHVGEVSGLFAQATPLSAPAIPLINVGY